MKKLMIVSLGIVCSIAALSACIDTHAQERQRQAAIQAAQDAVSTAKAELLSCRQAIYDSADYAPLRTHFNRPPTSGYPLATLIDTGHVTPAERAAYLTTHPRTQACTSAYWAVIGRYAPNMVAIAQGGNTRIEDELVKFLSGHLSWGEYTTKARDISAQTDAAIAEEQRAESARRAAQQEEEQNRRAALAAAWLASHPLQTPTPPPLPLPPPPQPIPQSHTITCQTFGNNTYCN